jgi:TonB family protein
VPDISITDFDPGSVNRDSIVIAFVVDEQGRASDVRVKQSCGNRTYDNLAKDAIARSRWNPAVAGGEPRRVNFEWKFQF